MAECATGVGENESVAGQRKVSFLSKPGHCDAASDACMSEEDTCGDSHSLMSPVAICCSTGSSASSQASDHRVTVEEPGNYSTPDPLTNKENTFSEKRVPDGISPEGYSRMEVIIPRQGSELQSRMS